MSQVQEPSIAAAAPADDDENGAEATKASEQETILLDDVSGYESIQPSADAEHGPLSAQSTQQDVEIDRVAKNGGKGINVNVSVDDDDDDNDSMMLDVLPPLLTPKHRMLRNETMNGITVVTCLIILMLSITFGGTLVVLGGYDNRSIPNADAKQSIWWTAVIVMTTFTAFAITMLACVLTTDPGVLPRSVDGCFPLPIPIRGWLELLHDAENPQRAPLRPSVPYLTMKDVDGTVTTGPTATYCTKCLIWRRDPHNVRYYHCPICQRCVAHFDHHCSVLGRCIAGRVGYDNDGNFTGEFGGNYKYFLLLILSAGVAWITCLTLFIVALCYRYPPQWVLPIALVVLIWMHQIILRRMASPTTFCVPAQRFMRSILNCYYRVLRMCRRSKRQRRAPRPNMDGARS